MYFDNQIQSYIFYYIRAYQNTILLAPIVVNCYILKYTNIYPEIDLKLLCLLGRTVIAGLNHTFGVKLEGPIPGYRGIKITRNQKFIMALSIDMIENIFFVIILNIVAQLCKKEITPQITSLLVTLYL
ncbi:Hypothetical_protein [Hexamita inflata]|uniref:Hypothetical_protein n=1 Tax=Hexamita inflata TaxID=28002 RepID=A0AA86UXG0_9EUKA|nr:Hypothetical protein HINF_LOCUS59519 [Hexamita inflata]